MTLLKFHLIAVSFWFGLLAAETVLELWGKAATGLRTVAVVHRWIDLLFEMPIALAVLISGGLLLAQLEAYSSLLLLKVAFGLITVFANLLCFPLVHARWKARDYARIEQLTRQIAWTGWGIPLGLGAFVIGLFFLRA